MRGSAIRFCASPVLAAALSIAMPLPTSAGPGGVKPPRALEDLELAERAFTRA